MTTYTALDRPLTVITVARDGDLHAVLEVAEKVRYVALAIGDWSAVQWLVCIDDLSLQPSRVLSAVRGLPVRHEVWVNASGQHGDESAFAYVEPFADGQIIVALNRGADGNADDIGHEVLAALYDGPEAPPNW